MCVCAINSSSSSGVPSVTLVLLPHEHTRTIGLLGLLGLLKLLGLLVLLGVLGFSGLLGLLGLESMGNEDTFPVNLAIPINYVQQSRLDNTDQDY